MSLNNNLLDYWVPSVSNNSEAIPPTKKARRLRYEKLPEEILPNQGRVKLRKLEDNKKNVVYTECNLLHEGVIVGTIRVTDKNYREYINVDFHEDEGFHYLQIKLTDEEERTCRENGLGDVKYVWARYEDKRTPIKKGKVVRRGRFRVQRQVMLVVLISLFDGIGGARVALDRMKDEFEVIASFSSEKDEYAHRVVQQYAPDTIELGDIEKITRKTVRDKIIMNKKFLNFNQLTYWDDEKLHVLVIAGPPCQNLSQASRILSNTKGVKGEASRLFFHVPRILHYLKDMVEGYDKVKKHHKFLHFIVENVQMSINNEENFSFFLNGAAPSCMDFSDVPCASLMKRRRVYFNSFLPRSEFGFYDFLRAPSYCMHYARRESHSLDRVLYNHFLDDYEFIDKHTGRKVTFLPTMTRTLRKDAVGQNVYFLRRKSDIKGTRPSPQNINGELHESDEDIHPSPQTINEELLGFGWGHTILEESHCKPRQMYVNEYGGSFYDEEFENKRRQLLGNTFMVFHIRFLLWHLYCGIKNMTLDDPKVVLCSPQEMCKKKERYHEYQGLLDDMGFDTLDKN